MAVLTLINSYLLFLYKGGEFINEGAQGEQGMSSMSFGSLGFG